MSESEPIEIKVTQPKPRTARERRKVNVRTPAALLGNAAVIAPASLFAAAGVTGLWTAGAAVVGAGVLGVSKARTKAKQDAKSAKQGAKSAKASRVSRLTRGKSAGGSTAGSLGKSSQGTGAHRKAASGKVARATKAARAALLGRKASGSSSSSNPATRSTKTASGSGVAAKPAGSKPSRSSRSGGALSGTAARVKAAWRKSGADMKRKKAVEARKKAALAKTGIGKISKTVRADIKDKPSTIPSLHEAAPISIAQLKDHPAFSSPLTSGVGNMSSNSPMAAMLALAEEMTRIATKWDPVADRIGMLEVIGEFGGYPAVMREVAKAAKIIATKAEGREGFPLNPIVLELIAAVAAHQESTARAADEIAPNARKIHQKQIEVLAETPHHVNNDLWSHSANREAS